MENGSEGCCVALQGDKQQKGFPNLARQDKSLHTVAEHRHCTLHRLEVAFIVIKLLVESRMGPGTQRSQGLLQEQHGRLGGNKKHSKLLELEQIQDLVFKQGPPGEPGLQLR